MTGVLLSLKKELKKAAFLQLFEHYGVYIICIFYYLALLQISSRSRKNTLF